MITVKKVSLTPSDIQNSNSSPIGAIAAPDFGYCNNIIACSAYLNFNTTKYTGLGRMNLSGLASGVYLPVFFDENLQTFEQPCSYPLLKDQSDQVIFTTVLPLFFTADSDILVGDSDVDYYIIYETKLIS